MTIIGITFDNQAVTATSDAVLHSSIVSDGVLRGCEVNFLGTTLTISPGYVIIAGRLCYLPAAENLEISAQAGVARVLLQIDLSKESSLDVFEQLSLIAQSANNVEGLPPLIQEDVNGGGLLYQFPLCVVSTAENGILSVVSAPAGVGPSQNFGAEPKRLQFLSVAVAPKSFEGSSTYDDFPFRAAVPLSGVLSGMVPEVIFAPADASSGIFAPVAAAYDGGVYVYASEKPAATTTIPTIILWR